MAEDPVFQKRIQHIGELVGQVESAADPNSRAMARELLESLMALHGGALERILELLSRSGEPGEAIIRKCADDELIGSVLLLYGLHPEDLHSRVTKAIERSRNSLASHSANAELVSIQNDGTVTVRLELKSSGGCGSTAALIRSTLEATLQNAAPDATSIIVEETGASSTKSGFVSVSQLKAAGSAVASFVTRAERDGN